MMKNIAKEAFQESDKQFVDINGYLLSREFAEGFQNIDTIKQIKQYKNDILLLQGDQDQAVPMKHTVLLKNMLDHVSMHVFAGADHCFEKHMYHEQLIDTISEFLTSTS